MLSTGLITEDIAKVAMTNGWDCYIAYGRSSVPGLCKEIKVGSVLATYEHYFENRVYDNEGLASRIATINLVKKIKKINPDIIHLHNIHDHYINYPILFRFLNKTDIKIVWTFHDFWAITGHCHHFIDANCQKWKVECDKCPLQHSTVNSFIDKSKRNFNLKKKYFLENRNLTIVPVSYWVGDMVKQSFLKDRPIEVIPNGIDIAAFSKSIEVNASLKFGGRFVILSIARDWAYGDRKGLDEYIKLSKLLKDDEIIVLVGMSADLAKQMPKNIIGLPRTTNREELVSLYTRADVLLSLSGAETFGLTVIEANICGTPAVVYDNTAPPSLITPETGYVARNKDIQDVYDKIKQIKTNGKQFYSEACIQHVKDHYDKNTNYLKYIELYEKLLKP